MSTERQEVLQRACDFLARREHSRQELQQKLSRHTGNKALIEELLDRLVEEGLQNDARFAESFVQQRVNMGHGPMKIQMELKQRGVAMDIIDEQLNLAAIDWYELAQQVREKKFGKSLPEDYPTKAKQSRFLYSRGFSSEQINNLIND